MTTSTRIEEAKNKAAAALSAELERIERDDTLRNVAPNYDAVKRTGHAGYCGVDTLTYEANCADDVAAIIGAWRDKYGAFLPIGKYSTSSTVITAHPYKEYAAPEALKAIEDDAVEARNSKGRGFSSVSFSFSPRVEGRRVEVTIDLAFRKHINGFEGRINAHYNKHGEPTTVEKTAPSAYNGAAFTVSFGGGSRDSADWRGIFNCDALLTALEA